MHEKLGWGGKGSVCLLNLESKTYEGIHYEAVSFGFAWCTDDLPMVSSHFNQSDEGDEPVIRTASKI